MNAISTDNPQAASGLQTNRFVAWRVFRRWEETDIVCKDVNKVEVGAKYIFNLISIEPSSELIHVTGL